MNDNSNSAAAGLPPEDAAPESENRRETGARKYPVKDRPDASGDFSQDAAANKAPPPGIGLTEVSSDDDEKTRHSDGHNSSAGDRRGNRT